MIEQFVTIENGNVTYRTGDYVDLSPKEAMGVISKYLKRTRGIDISGKALIAMLKEGYPNLNDSDVVAVSSEYKELN